MEFAGAFRNWAPVWTAYRTGGTLPPLEFRGGIELHHGEGDDPIFLFREIFRDRCYTSEVFYVPKAGDTVLDLGANIGAFALFLELQARGIRVHCFEPSLKSCATLERNVEANGLEDLVTVYPYAVSNHRGTVALQQTGTSITRSLFREESSAGDAEPVECIGLAEAIELSGAERVDLLKVDVEGAEIEVVEGMDPAGWGKVERAVIEFHDQFRPGCRERVTQALAAGGFDRIEAVEEPTVAGLGFIRASRD